MEFFFQSIESGDIIVFSASHLLTSKSLLIGAAIGYVEENKVNVWQILRKNRRRFLLALPWVVEPMDNQWMEVEEPKATKQYFLAENPSNQYKNSQNVDVHILTIDLGTDMTPEQKEAIMHNLRKYRKIWP